MGNAALVARHDLYEQTLKFGFVYSAMHVNLRPIRALRRHTSIIGIQFQRIYDEQTVVENTLITARWALAVHRVPCDA